MLGSLGRLGNSLAVPRLGCRCRMAFVLAGDAWQHLAALPSFGRPKKLNDFNARQIAGLAVYRRLSRCRAATVLDRRRSLRTKSEYACGIAHG